MRPGAEDLNRPLLTAVQRAAPELWDQASPDHGRFAAATRPEHGEEAVIAELLDEVLS